MKLQRGQTLVEFALVVPLLALFIFGMIYGGAMFMQYLNFSNEARQIAREVSVLDNVDNRFNIIKSKLENINFARFYTVKPQIYFIDKDNKKIVYNESGNLVYDTGTTGVTEGTSTPSPVDVVVEFEFERDNQDLPWVLYKVGFPPEKINPIIYQMRLEKPPTQNS